MWSLAVSALMSGTTVSAATILYEPCDYSAGTLNGQNGGAGSGSRRRLSNHGCSA